MKFSLFEKNSSQSGRECTYDEYLLYADSDRVRRICAAISHEEDKEKRGKLKAQLPVVTWQAYFPGRRLNNEAQPSGLFMLDIDHVDHPGEVYTKKIAGRLNELGIVFVGITASMHGLRIIAKCRKEYKTIDECQQWLSHELGVEWDRSCKDMARCSYLVSSELTLYMDAKAIWQTEPEEGTVYRPMEPVSRNLAFEQAIDDMVGNEHVDQREGLFGGVNEYNGLSLAEIAVEWLKYTGGEPKDGERNTRLYRLATRMRYICDFNETTMLRVMPRYGLSEEEMKTLIHSAKGTQRASDIPRDLREVITKMEKLKNMGAEETDSDNDLINDTSKLPPMPPLIRQMVNIAPADFKQAVLLCQLPILGALASKLRARYLDGQMHSPSFQVSLEAPQASGKSFMGRLVDYELGMVKEHDEEQRQKELEYDKKAREMKMLNIKVTPENKDEVLGSRPQSLIRIVPPTISITKLLMRMNDARGLHLFCFCPEADTMTKAFKRGFSSFSDLLRISFDNEVAGQDYATETSFSGVVRMYYNLLLSGTPKAMRRFYPDVEDGLVSRVCFIELPDQFGKNMPEWKELSAKDKLLCDTTIVRLNDISIQGDEVQKEHEMDMPWLNEGMKKWIREQQAEAVKNDDRTRDIFCRRAAVVGFRAGMLAWFLWNENSRKEIKNKVIAFSRYVADSMLSQHLLRFNIASKGSNTMKWPEIYELLPDEFTRAELERLVNENAVGTPVKQVIFNWRSQKVIEAVEEGRNDKGQKLIVSFKKINKS